MIVHGVYRVLMTGETDSVCQHNAPGPWTDNLEEMTCPDCKRVVIEQFGDSWL